MGGERAVPRTFRERCGADEISNDFLAGRVGVPVSLAINRKDVHVCV